MLRIFARTLPVLLVGCGATPNQPPSSVPPNPRNVVLIVTDDQGYGDVGVYGSRTIATPNLDRMAGEGARFTDFYVAQPVCSASRAAILTGCYPNRIGIAGALGPHAKHGLAESETTLAEMFGRLGFVTGAFGKWHLGHRAPFLPDQHGFDESLVVPYSNDMWPWHPLVAHLPPHLVKRKSAFPPLVLFEDGEVFDAEVTPDDQALFTETFTARAVDFIERHRNERFFLYLAHPQPHVPLFRSPAFEGRSAGGVYGDVIEEIDASVGRVLEALEEAGIADDTLVFFTSDNGPWLLFGDHGGSAFPLREGKATTFEGGVRVPAIARWPRGIPAGHVGSEPWMTIDLLPTLARLCGAPLPELPIDGKDASSLLLGRPGANSPAEAYFFWYGGSLRAVRSGNWKLHLPHAYVTLEGGRIGTSGSPGRYAKDEFEQPTLFDLTAPGGEFEAVDARGVRDHLVRLADQARLRLGGRGVVGTEVRPRGELAHAPGAE